MLPESYAPTVMSAMSQREMIKPDLICNDSEREIHTGLLSYLMGIAIMSAMSQREIIKNWIVI